MLPMPAMTDPTTPAPEGEAQLPDLEQGEIDGRFPDEPQAQSLSKGTTGEEVLTEATKRFVGLMAMQNPDKIIKMMEDLAALQRDNEKLREEYGRGVTAGKLEALAYTPEERDAYGRYVAANDDWKTLRTDLATKDAQIAELREQLTKEIQFRDNFL